MSEAVQSALAGQTVNNYRIIEKLGAGGMGVVYKALDTRLDRTVALKFLPPELGSADRSRDNFLQEARAASALDHPNIGVIHGIEESPAGSLFIVMAYYEGETLSQKIRRGPLDPAQAVPIALDMARGLAEAHSRNIVHRDIKPSNTIVTTQGLVKIVDFGLARFIHSASSTQSAGISGTAAYMSPEQAVGKPLDHRTDLWSLGVVLYELLTARLPFYGGNAPATLFAIVNSPPAPMEDVPGELQQIAYRALAKDPADRYQSAAEFAADLEKVALPDASGQTRTVTAKDLRKYAQRAGAPPPSRRRWIAASVAIATVVLVALLVFAIWQRGPSDKHIAVLPFASIGGNAQDTLADGLMESLTSKLSNLELGSQSLWVVPSSEVRRRKVADADAAHREFGVTLVVTGAVQREQNSVRLIVNLIDARNMRQLGSGQFEDRTGDFSLLQDSAVAKLANLMRIPLTRDMLRSTGGSAAPAAYESYLKALGYVQRYDKPGNLDQAIGLLDGAVKTDPRFALAFAGLGEAYLLKFKSDQNTRWIDQASAHCLRAIQLNDQLAPVYVTLGRIHDASGKQALALQEFQRALDLDPRNPEALFGLAQLYENQARLKEAEQSFRRAAALRPDYWDGHSKLGLFLYRQRRFADAIPLLRKVVDLTPDNAIGHLNLGAALIGAQKLPEAAQVLEKAISIAPSYAAYANLGNVYYRQGRWAKAAQTYAEGLKLNDKDFRLWINLAGADRWLNQDADAMAAYRRALVLIEDLARVRPEDATVQSSLGLLYARFGQRAKALERLEAALVLAPKDTSVMSRAGEAHEALGDRPDAVEWINKAARNGHPMDSIRRNPELRGVVADPGFKPPVK